MKKIIGLLIIPFFFLVAKAQEVNLIGFDTTDSIECYNSNQYSQLFSMPTGTDYYLTKIGVKVCESSAAGKFFFGLYAFNGDLLFKSTEFNYPGGIDSTLVVDVPLGIQSLLGDNSYYVACIYKGVGSYYLKKGASVVNNGVANLDNFSSFNASVVYPNFSDPIVNAGAYAFNPAFVLVGEVKTAEIVPDNDILDFNCASNIGLIPGNIYYSQITMPAGSNKELRSIGIKTDTCSATGVLKFAVYDNALNLLYVSEEAQVDVSVQDTATVNIPSGMLTLSALGVYHVAVQIDGSENLSVLKMKVPVSRGLASFSSDYGAFKNGFTYPSFPSILSAQGLYAFNFGFVLSSAEQDVVTSVNNTIQKQSNNFRIFPSIVDKKIDLYAQDSNHEVLVIIYRISGSTMDKVFWDTTAPLSINVDAYPQGSYLVKVGDEVLKFIKK